MQFLFCLDRVTVNACLNKWGLSQWIWNEKTRQKSFERLKKNTMWYLWSSEALDSMRFMWFWSRPVDATVGTACCQFVWTIDVTDTWCLSPCLFLWILWIFYWALLCWLKSNSFNSFCVLCVWMYAYMWLYGKGLCTCQYVEAATQARPSFFRYVTFTWITTCKQRQREMKRTENACVVDIKINTDI